MIPLLFERACKPYQRYSSLQVFKHTRIKAMFKPWDRYFRTQKVSRSLYPGEKEVIKYRYNTSI
jgi:hypothetical protein